MALLVGPRRTAAQDDTVRIRCEALTPDDAAQVEARTRATLLTAPAGNLSVRVLCDGSNAAVLVTAGERSEAVTLTLAGDRPREALLAAIESTLAALQRQEAGATAAFPGASSVTSTPKPVVAPPHPQSVAPASPQHPTTSLRGERPGWLVGAGAIGELWDDELAYGVRLGVERRQPPWVFGVTFGWLTAGEKADSFRANELSASLFGAIEDRRSTGLRASLGVGMSVLVVAPNPELIVRSDTTLPLAFLDLGLSRPVRFGRAALVPAVGLRLFPGRREVHVDSTRELVLPPLSPSLFLGFGYEI